MFTRVFFTLHMAWRHRTALKQYAQDSHRHIDQITNLNCSKLKSQGISALALDFDGVLSSHGEIILSKKLFDWLKDCVHTLGAGRVFILSNKPTELRSRYFEEHFPGIIFVMASKKKPYPDGLLYALAYAKVNAHALLMVDDRLLTGILAAILVGANGCLVTKPLVDFRKRPIIESVFWLLRKGERWLF